MDNNWMRKHLEVKRDYINDNIEIIDIVSKTKSINVINSKILGLSTETTDMPVAALILIDKFIYAIDKSGIGIQYPLFVDNGKVYASLSDDIVKLGLELKFSVDNLETFKASVHRYNRYLDTRYQISHFMMVV